MPTFIGSGPTASRAVTSVPKSGMGARSYVVGAGAGSGAQTQGTGWERLPTFYSAGLMRSHWVTQQRDRQLKGRDSTAAADERRKGMRWIEPPFDLDALTSLLFESVDFFAVVDQFATDVAGLGWDLVDVEDPTGPAAVPEFGEVDRDADNDQVAVAQRVQGTEFLKNLAEDFDGNKIPIKTLCHCAVMDHEAIGNGYIEASRDWEVLMPNGKGRINGLFHVPGRLVRRLADINGFVQLDNNGKEVAIFRGWGTDANAESSRYDAHEGRRFGKPTGTIKNELKQFKRYHSAEAYYGVPQVISALVALYGNIFSDSRNLRYFINRSVPEWLVTVKAEMHNWSDESFTQLVDDYISEVTEHLKYMIEGDDYRTLVTKVPSDALEVEWTKLSPDIKDQDFQEYQTRNRDMIVRAYRMLPHRIGIIETASLGAGTGESQEETYKRAQVDPRQEMLESFFDEILEETGIELVQFKFREIDMLDEQREAGIYQGVAGTKILTVNEMRRWVSRIVKDQDFPDYDDDQADIPLIFVEPQILGGGFGFGPGTPLLEPYAAGEIQGAPVTRQLSMTPTVDPRYANVHRRIQQTLARRDEMRERIMGRSNGEGQARPVDDASRAGESVGAGTEAAGDGSG